MPNFVYAILLFMGLVSLYIGLYILNRKTPKPAGCEDLKAQCDGCHDFLCTNNPVHEAEKKGL